MKRIELKLPLVSDNTFEEITFALETNPTEQTGWVKKSLKDEDDQDGMQYLYTPDFLLSEEKKQGIFFRLIENVKKLEAEEQLSNEQDQFLHGTETIIMVGQFQDNLKQLVPYNDKEILNLLQIFGFNFFQGKSVSLQTFRDKIKEYKIFFHKQKTRRFHLSILDAFAAKEMDTDDALFKLKKKGDMFKGLQDEFEFTIPDDVMEEIVTPWQQQFEMFKDCIADLRIILEHIETEKEEEEKRLKLEEEERQKKLEEQKLLEEQAKEEKEEGEEEYEQEGFEKQDDQYEEEGFDQ